MSRESLRVAIMGATATLTAAGVGSPQFDAETLASHLLGVERTRLGLTPLVESEWVASYHELINRRAAREPLQHIIGLAHVGRVSVEVGPGVFVPRPETEVLIGWALDAIEKVKAPVVVDLCSGSGAIALAIAAERSDATVFAVERAPGALAWARRNIELQAAAGVKPVQLRGGDVLDPRLLSDLDATADLVTANPPYVPAGTEVEPEVGDYDPAEAVFSGADGLELMRPLVSVIAGLLRPGGVCAVEHDDTQGQSVPELFAARRIFADVADHLDLNGRPRFVTARRVRLS